MGLFNTNVETVAVPLTTGGEYRPDSTLLVADGVLADTALINLAKRAQKEGFVRVMNVRVVGNFDNSFNAYGDAVKE